MAVLAFRMTFLIVDIAATSSTRVSRALGKEQIKGSEDDYCFYAKRDKYIHPS